MAVFSSFCAAQPADAAAALVRLEDIPGFDFDAGLDALFYISLSDAVLSDTSMAFGGTDLRSLRIGGSDNDPLFTQGATGAQSIAALYSGDVWVTLVPDSTAQFGLHAAKGSASNTIWSNTLAVGQALYLEVPEPGSLALVLPMLAAMGLTARRRRRSIV
jgi:hypothetical protein